MKRSVLLLAVAFLVCVSGIAMAQQTDISASVTAPFETKVSGKGIDESATKAAGLLFSFRHFSTPHSGFEVNYGYTKDTHKYSSLSGTPLTSVQSSMHEFSVAYVFHITHGAFQPFALAGAGVLSFSPTDSAIKSADPDISSKKKISFLYGAGVDVRMSKTLALRAQYRGLLYQAPDFFGDQYALHTGAAMQTMEPSIGLVYRF